MTKHIRIENADLSDWKVKVLIQDRQYNAETDSCDGEWKTTETHDLNSPTQLLTHFITGSRRIVIEESGHK